MDTAAVVVSTSATEEETALGMDIAIEAVSMRASAAVAAAVATAADEATAAAAMVVDEYSEEEKGGVSGTSLFGEIKVCGCEWKGPAVASAGGGAEGECGG